MPSPKTWPCRLVTRVAFQGGGQLAHALFFAPEPEQQDAQLAARPGFLWGGGNFFGQLVQTPLIGVYPAHSFEALPRFVEPPLIEPHKMQDELGVAVSRRLSGRALQEGGRVVGMPKSHGQPAAFNEGRDVLWVVGQERVEKLGRLPQLGGVVPAAGQAEEHVGIARLVLAKELSATARS